MPIQPLSFRWEGTLIEKIDAVRGLASRTAFVAQAIEALLAGDLVPIGLLDTKTAANLPGSVTDEAVMAILRRIPEGRPVLTRPLTADEALRKVQARHRARAAEIRQKQAERLDRGEAG